MYSDHNNIGEILPKLCCTYDAEPSVHASAYRHRTHCTLCPSPNSTLQHENASLTTPDLNG